MSDPLAELKPGEIYVLGTLIDFEIARPQLGEDKAFRVHIVDLAERLHELAWWSYGFKNGPTD